MDDLLREFLTETSESIAAIDVELVNLEQNPNNPKLIDNIFRLVHTVKGTCGFLGLPRLERVTHAAENVLGKFRDGKLVATPSAVTVILQSIDQVKMILVSLETTQAEPAGDDSDLIDSLNALAIGDEMASSTTRLETVIAPAREAAAAPKPEPVLAAAKPAAAKPKPTKVEEERLSSDPSVATQTIRVNVDLLENLMNMVSELVLTRNQLLQMVRGLDNSEFIMPLQRLSHVTTELQEGVMKTRMQPIGNAWAKLPRIIRDLSVELDKKIDLQLHGAATELDRQVLELIKDPLTHMVRNSADHGLEKPDERLAAGKPATGKIVLNAYHEGGHIVIEVKDDGRGLNVDRIKAKALEKGLVTEADLESMSDQQVTQFIFKPGFSTAQAVTSVSGRGVGMDVVRTNIEKIGGTCDLKSEAGKGSIFTVKIPLTLAIVSALIVECGGERFAVPQISVVELVHTSANSEQRIEHLHDTPVLRLRNRLLPLIFLDETLKLVDRKASDRTDEAFVVVVQVGSYSFGVVVDRVFDTEEIVVKPVAPILRGIPIFSGNTILGDGSVIMILDPNGVAAISGAVAVTDIAHVDEEQQRESRSEDLTTLLVFRAGGSNAKAVPLSLVTRLEEIDAAQIEHSNGHALVQYRGKLMPLVKVSDSCPLKTEGRQPVLVFADGDKSVGLAVDEIVDIVEVRLNIELRGQEAGVIGSAVVDGRATEITDAGFYLNKAFENWFVTNIDNAAGGVQKSKRVLLVDDSPFFRNMLAPLLSVAGYSVTTAEDADTAFKIRDSGRDFDVIISDIEMPGMNGFEFAAAVKRDDRWHKTPIVALSSRAAKGDLDRGREVGFADYVAKFDRDTLLNSLSQTLADGEAA
jgi:two-component system chemotaxis sensor kinase CheA